MGVAQFAEAQTIWRSGSLVLKEVRRALSQGQEGKARLALALEALAVHSAAAVPRRVPLDRTVPPVLLFTDAAAEEDLVTLGAVIFDPVSGTFSHFGAGLAQASVEIWKKGGRTQVIGQAELIAIPIAMETWAEVHSFGQVIMA